MARRINRKTFLFRMIGLSLLQLINYLYYEDVFNQGYESFGDNFTTAWIISILLISSGLSQVVLRLHDINLSGWFAFFALIPIINIPFIALYFIPGTKGSNKYGENCKNSIFQPIFDLSNYKRRSMEKDISTINYKTKLLKDSFNSGLITQNEFNDKVGKLTVNRENIESRLEEINVTKVETELIWNQLDGLKVLRNKRILNQKEYNEKVKSLFKRLKEMRNVKRTLS
ncbi:MAG: DUF805 domain-containing protein [Lutibacter sp.]|nr:DUF805 domain-containing protein [Lutibacter sp.]